ncbi:MAG: S41 family peptidase [Cyanobacteriota bacterium]
MDSKKISIALSLPILLIMMLGIFINEALATTPQSLYDEVWRLINTKYVDQTENNQDWERWRHKYDQYIQTDEDAYVAIETMLASLNDKYTRFLDPDEFKEENESIRAQLYGVGMQIGVRDNKLVVIAPLEETPAERAGLKANDEIVSIDGNSTKGLSVKDAADMIRGRKGTKVKLLIRRNNKDKLYEITRDEIKIKAASKRTPFDTKVPKKIGYIRLNSFLSKNASNEIRALLKDDYNDKDAVILDIRSNPGGLLSNAVSISDMFLDDGAIVSTVDRDGYKEIKKASSHLIWKKPIVIMIDGGSASASEILSGALKDHHRAILVGVNTFGKGLVQEINHLPGRAGINITTQKYLTPNDTDINKRGIQPDIEVKNTEDDFKNKNDKQLIIAIKIAEDLIEGKSPNAITASAKTYIVK